MIRAVVFDLDGTLIDSTEAIVASFTHMFDHLGLPFPGREAIIGSIGHPLREQLGFLTSHAVDECVTVYRAHYAETSCARTSLIPGALELIENLHEAGLKLAFATSKSCIAACMLLEHLGVLDYFEVRIGPEQVTHTKPHPEPILKALDALGVARNEAIFVGDMHFDLQAGAAAGVRTLAVATGYATREELEAHRPEAVFDALDQLQAWLLAALRTQQHPRPPESVLAGEP